MSRGRKKHNTSICSTLSLLGCIREEIILTGKEEVLEYLSKSVRGRTSRQISNDLKKERTAITKYLNDLVKESKVKILKYGKCKTTRRKVGYYAIIRK